jgi:hypothetical protein
MTKTTPKGSINGGIWFSFSGWRLQNPESL